MPKQESLKGQNKQLDPQQQRSKHELKDDPTQALEEGEPGLTGRTRDQKEMDSDQELPRAKPPRKIGRHGSESM